MKRTNRVTLYYEVCRTPIPYKMHVNVSALSFLYWVDKEYLKYYKLSSFFFGFFVLRYISSILSLARKTLMNEEKRAFTDNMLSTVMCFKCMAELGIETNDSWFLKIERYFHGQTVRVLLLLWNLMRELFFQKYQNPLLIRIR